MKHPVASPGEHIKRIVAALVLTMVLAPILLLAYPFGSAVGYTVGFGPHGIVAADLNGDGKLDLASANAEDGTVSVLIGNGDGTYLPHADYPVGTRPKFVQTGDFNRDGKVDLIAANEVSGSVTVLPGKGDGTFGTGISSPAGCISPHAIGIADLNGDGKLDAIVALLERYRYQRAVRERRRHLPARCELHNGRLARGGRYRRLQQGRETGLCDQQLHG